MWVNMFLYKTIVASSEIKPQNLSILIFFQSLMTVADVEKALFEMFSFLVNISNFPFLFSLKIVVS